MTWAWPVEVTHLLPTGEVMRLRPLRRGDRAEWEQLRSRNEERLAPWESTVPGTVPERPSFRSLRRGLDRAARDGLVLPWVIEVDGRICGQVQLFDVLWGARRCGWVGYWLADGCTGRGYATWAVAALVDHALLEVGLHRVDIAIRPENAPSLAVMARLGIPEEGVQRGLMHVDGGWRDHRTFALVQEDVLPGGQLEGGLLSRLRGEKRL